MKDYPQEFKELIESLGKIFNKSFVENQDYEIIDLGQPHNPINLKEGCTAVYTFIYNDEFLKIGMVGCNSNARYKFQHYNTNQASSTLALKIQNDTEMYNLVKNSQFSIGDWIKNNTRRIDILIKNDDREFITRLIESAMHYKYNPKFEG